MLKRLIYVVLCGFLISCSSDQKNDSSTAEGAFKSAEEYEKADRFEEAVIKYGEVKNQYPYSRFAVMAEMKMADLHFKREAYIEAQSAYQLFKELHPKHPQIDYVTFQIGMSYFKQLPPTMDRDLTLARKAIVSFDEVIRNFPGSTFAVQAAEKKSEAFNMLAQKELYIARFYLHQKQYAAALGRFETILQSYPDHSEKEALYGAAVCAEKNSEPNRARNYLSTLESKYPDSSEYKNAKSETKL